MNQRPCSAAEYRFCVQNIPSSIPSIYRYTYGAGAENKTSMWGWNTIHRALDPKQWRFSGSTSLPQHAFCLPSSHPSLPWKSFPCLPHPPSALHHSYLILKHVCSIRPPPDWALRELHWIRYVHLTCFLKQHILRVLAQGGREAFKNNQNINTYSLMWSILLIINI